MTATAKLEATLAVTPAVYVGGAITTVVAVPPSTLDADTTNHIRVYV